MDRLDVSNGFDIHEYRTDLKLIRQDRDRMTLANRGDLTCPSCGEVFDRVLVIDARTASLPTPDRPLCLARADETMLVLTH